MDGVLRARGDKAALGGNEKISLTNLRAEFTTFNTGGSLLTTPQVEDPTSQSLPNKLVPEYHTHSCKYEFIS